MLKTILSDDVKIIKIGDKKLTEETVEKNAECVLLNKTKEDAGTIVVEMTDDNKAVSSHLYTVKAGLFTNFTTEKIINVKTGFNDLFHKPAKESAEKSDPEDSYYMGVNPTEKAIPATTEHVKLINLVDNFYAFIITVTDEKAKAVEVHAVVLGPKAEFKLDIAEGQSISVMNDNEFSQVWGMIEGVHTQHH